MAIKGCKACGNRYPESDGVGPFKEFCCDGCWEDWESNHPGYTKEQNRTKRISYLTIAAIVLDIFIWICTR